MTKNGLHLRDGLEQAVTTLSANPLRAALSALAMAAAVATTAIVVTGLNALAESARLTSARAFGSDTFIIAKVFPTGLSRRALADQLARNPDIRRQDLRFLDRHAAGRVLYAPVAQQAGDITAGGRSFERALLNGTTVSLAAIRDIGLEQGRFWTSDEDTRAAPVVIIGRAIAETLFPGADPIGQAVRIAGRRFSVIGVLFRQGTAGGVSLDRYAWLPFTAYARMFGAPASLQIFARAPHSGQTTGAEDRARASLRARRQLASGEADTFQVLTPEASRSFVENITSRIGAAGPPISFMALLAAIVVIANTALVSVTARTREIGVRRAVGAPRAQIVLEVLTESVLVAVVGGFAGLAIAAGAMALASRALDVAMALDAATVVLSLGAASASALAAAWYPARRAAAIDVIAALRAE
jgi:putative ABC transport system permease protein